MSLLPRHKPGRGTRTSRSTFVGRRPPRGFPLFESFGWQHEDATGGRLRQTTIALRRIMGNVKDLDSTAIYAWTTLISVLICVPAAAIFEGPALKAGIDRAAAAHPEFYWKLAAVGLLYHLYNQVSPLLRSRSSFPPLSPTVCIESKAASVHALNATIFVSMPVL